MSSARKIKVLVCAYSCVSESGVNQVGGEAELGFQLTKQLSRFSDVYVVTHYHNKKAIEAVLAEAPLSNVTFFYIALPRFLSFLEKFHKGGIQVYSYLWQIKAYLVALQLHKKFTFDVFHHITYANDWMASFMGALLPVPYIRGPGGGAHHIPKNFLKQYSFSEKVFEHLRGVGQWIFRHDPFFIMGQNRAKAILVCNQEAFEAMPLSWQKKSQFFPVNGVSKEDFGGGTVKSTKEFLIVSAGKMLKLKRFDLAIKAFKMFHDDISSSKLLIVGEGPEMDNLKKLSKTLQIEDAVVFEKWMKRKALLEKIAKANVFLFTSLRDGGAAVVVEAMAQGTPVVCFDISGPGFHVQKEWGIKIKPHNEEQAVEDIAVELKNLHAKKELQDALGQSARKRARDFYLWDNLGEKLKEIYQQIL